MNERVEKESIQGNILFELGEIEQTRKNHTEDSIGLDSITSSTGGGNFLTILCC